MSIEITLSHDLDDFKELESEWVELMENSNAFGAALSWPWLNVWLKHFHASGEMWLLVAREQTTKKLLGVAPLFKRVVKPKYGFSYRQIEFIGTSQVYENLDFLIQDGLEVEIIPNFIETLLSQQSDWDVIHLAGVFGEKLITILQSCCPSWSRSTKRDMVSPYISLPSDSETWFKTLSSNRRWKLRNARKKLEKAFPGSWRITEVVSHEQLNGVFDHLVDLHQQEWEKRGAAGAFHYREWVVYYRELMHVIMDQGWLRMNCLYIQEQPAVILFAYHYRGRAYNQISGMNYDLTRIPVGHVMTQFSVEMAISDSMKEYLFMWGDESYKYSFGAVNRTLYAFEFISTTRVRVQKGTIRILQNLKRMIVGEKR